MLRIYGEQCADFVISMEIIVETGRYVKGFGLKQKAIRFGAPY